MTLIALFPGQGSQFPGMGKEWVRDFSYAREMLESASQSLNLDFARLCFEGPEDELTRTENTQPCLLLISCIGFEILSRELNFSPVASAGHSLGEYSALVCARALDFEDGLKLTRKRGELMAQAGKANQGGMMAVMGLSAEDVEKLCQDAARGEVLVPANFNAPSQVVISGTNSALERAQELLRQRKAKGIRLKVSAAFHSPLMQAAADGLAVSLSNITFHQFRFPVISNLEAKEYPGPESAKDILVKQVVNPVRWTECIERLKSFQPKFFVEIGPGKVLAGLVKKISPEIPVLNFASTADLKLIQEALQ